MEMNHDVQSEFVSPYPPPPRTFVLVAALLFLLSFAATPVSAAAIAVTSTCSLAQAIQSANDDAAPTGSTCAAGSGADTITLSADVVPSAPLPAITSNVTINGGNFKISHVGSSNLYNGAILRSAAGSSLTLEDLLLEWGGGGTPAEAALELGGDATLSDVSIGTCFRLCVRGSGSGATYTFTKVAMHFTFSAYYTPAAILAEAGTFTMTNMAFRDMRGGGESLLRVNSGASVTLNGCLYINRVLPQLKSGSGTLTNNSNSVCTGTIGNNETLFAPATVETTNTCGIYESWPVISVTDDVSRTVTLSANCNILTGPIYVPHNMHLTVSSPSGSRFAIKSQLDNHIFVVAGKLTLSNVDLEGRLGTQQLAVALNAIDAWNAKSISLQDVVVSPESATGQHRAGLFLVNVAETTLTRVTFRDHNIGSNFWQGSAMTVVGESKVKISDSTFSNNRGGAGAIRVHSANSRVNLATSSSFSNNDPLDIQANAVSLTSCAGCLPENVKITGVRPGSGDGKKAGPGGPVVYTGELLETSGLRLWARYGLRSGIQFQRRAVGAIGIQSLIDGGVLDVVDVWGYAEQGWELCFPQAGSLVFLDAAGSPRVPESVAAYNEDGYTCMADDRAGLVLLLSGPSIVAASAARDRVLQGRHLGNCMVRTNYILNFRETPGGAPLHFVDIWGREVPGLLPYDVTLTALERTAEWYRVDYHGTQGWISARYVTPLGDCGQGA